MRAYGINYDTGLTVEGRSTRPSFVEDEVRRDMRAIANDLHANAIRVSGEDLGRLEFAGRCALESGLEVWLSPASCDRDADAYVDHVVGGASAAERLRSGGDAEVVAVLGTEMSLFAKGFVPGDLLSERIAAMMDPATWSSPDRLAEMQAGFERGAAALRAIAGGAREVFGGRITYAAGAWEQVEWDLFDVVSIDAYRDVHSAPRYREQVRSYARFGKPLAITEFGCCTYAGAGAAGGTGWLILDQASPTPRLTGVHQRDEAEQVRYFRELMEVFDAESVDSAFWFSFAGFALPHRDDPARDVDMASYGAVAVSDIGPDGSQTWRPKQVFHAIAEDCSRRAGRAAR
jgi:hypothetical protein